MGRAVFCIASNEEQAVEIINNLRSEGFANTDISVLFPDKSGPNDLAHVARTKAPEGATAGVGAGALLGGSLGWLAGIGALAIPSLGPLVAAGPIVAALSGAAVGGTVGGVTGAMIGAGIPEYEARRFEGKVRDGNILISVHAPHSAQARRAEDIFRAAGCADIATTRVHRDESKGSEVAALASTPAR